MAGNDIDLLDAIRMYQANTQQAATTNALTFAAQEMQNINNSTIKEEQKRQNLQTLGNQLAVHLTGLGAQPHQIQQAVGAIAPKQFATPEAAMTEGVLTGNQQLTKLGSRAVDLTFQKNLKQFAAQEYIKEKSDERRFQREAYIQQLKNQPELMKQGKLTSEDINKISEADNQIDFAHNLLYRVNQASEKAFAFGAIGPMNRKMPDVLAPEDAAIRADVGQFFDLYRKAITGAGAGKEEIKMLEAHRPTEDDPLPVFVKKMEAVINTGQRIRDRHVRNLGLGGKQVDAFVKDRQQQEATKAQESSLMSLIQGSLVGGQ